MPATTVVIMAAIAVTARMAAKSSLRIYLTSFASRPRIELGPDYSLAARLSSRRMLCACPTRPAATAADFPPPAAAATDAAASAAMGALSPDATPNATRTGTTGDMQAGAAAPVAPDGRPTVTPAPPFAGRTRSAGNPCSFTRKSQSVRLGDARPPRLCYK